MYYIYLLYRLSLHLKVFSWNMKLFFMRLHLSIKVKQKKKHKKTELQYLGMMFIKLQISVNRIYAG